MKYYDGTYEDNYYLPTIGYYYGSDDDYGEEYYHSLSYLNDQEGCEQYTEAVLELNLDKVWEVLWDLRTLSKKECQERGIRHSSTDDDTIVEIWPRNNLCLPTQL